MHLDTCKYVLQRSDQVQPKKDVWQTLDYVRHFVCLSFENIQVSLLQNIRFFLDGK